MKTIYRSDDGVEFDDEGECKAHEARKGLIRTAYAISLELMPTGKLRREAITYSKWLRDKQNYPATDSGEHHCCDLLNELVTRV